MITKSVHCFCHRKITRMYSRATNFPAQDFVNSATCKRDLFYRDFTLSRARKRTLNESV